MTTIGCVGPLVWFDVDNDGRPAAILECAACSDVVVTGTYNDEAHNATPLLRGA